MAKPDNLIRIFTMRKIPVIFVDTKKLHVLKSLLNKHSSNSNSNSKTVVVYGIQFEIDQVTNELTKLNYKYETCPDDDQKHVKNFTNQMYFKLSYVTSDSYVIYDFLENHYDYDFDKINKSINWTTMNQYGSPVPRMVCIQALIKPDGLIPVYRHPVDSQPKTEPFNNYVKNLALLLSGKFGCEFNHVLIQLYRNGHDYIGEHSDKTLDIVPGTPIINYTLGATRFLQLKSKTTDEKHHIGLQNNSLFVLGLETNAKYYHLIKQDKRMPSEKLAEELINSGQRISFTFRSIGTWLNPDGKLEGLGASKTNCTDNIDNNTNIQIHQHKIDSTTDPKLIEQIEMIKAFGHENKGTVCDRNLYYPNGFSVI